MVDSGLSGINISIDSLDRETFKNITSHDRLPEILKGIKNLARFGFENIKINGVLLNGINASEKDFDKWSEFIKKNKIDYRYIELMRTGDNLITLKNIMFLQKFLKIISIKINGSIKLLVKMQVQH